jgi:hypothetical protein
MSQRPPFHLVPDSLSHDTVEALKELLLHAKTGRLIGVAFVAMYKNREYIANTAGEASRNPTFTRGMVAALDDALGRVVTGRASQ